MDYPWQDRKRDRIRHHIKKADTPVQFTGLELTVQPEGGVAVSATHLDTPLLVTGIGRKIIISITDDLWETTKLIGT